LSHPSSKKLISASRGSPLALWQANYVKDLLTDKGHEIEIKTWKTTGDIVQDRFLHEIGGKGLFIRELEDAMRRGEADFAVHSLKDLPARIPDGFNLTAVLKRHTSTDVMIFSESFYKHTGLTPGQMIDEKTLKSFGPIRIATSSLRRSSLLRGVSSEISTVPVRGNVDTRLKKLESEGWHAIILAQASIERLNIQNIHAHTIEPSWFVPCAGQGALAIETLSANPAAAALKSLECEMTRLAVDIERSVLARLGGDCTMPFGCHVTADPRKNGNLLGRAVVLNTDGSAARSIKSMPMTATTRVDLENCMIDELRNNGANEILAVLGIAIRI
jgi:hydroxymethylbilane synthase